MLTVGSLFSGIGGFDLGLERAGMRVIWQSEIDPYASSVLRKHWPDVPNLGDIRNITATSVAALADAASARRAEAREHDGGSPLLSARFSECRGVPDVICGGFPCQDISNAGKRAGIDGERSGLWSEYARVIGELRPRYVLVENVSALLGRGIERVLGDLAALGFDAEWHCIPASAVGAPHRRDRVWIIANAIGEPIRGQQRSAVTGEASEIQREAWERERLRADVGAARGGADVADADSNAWHKGRSRDAAQSITGRDIDRGYVDWNEQQWFAESGMGRVSDGVPSRVDRLRCLGNAIVPQVAEIIGRAIMNQAEA